MTIDNETELLEAIEMIEIRCEEMRQYIHASADCSICNKSVQKSTDNTCEECERTFCENHNTIGSHSNNAENEYLNNKCDTCSIDWISGLVDNPMLEDR